MEVLRGTALGDKATRTWVLVCVCACVCVRARVCTCMCGWEAGGRVQAEGGSWGHSHDVSEHTHSPDVRGRADGVSLYHPRS